MQPFVRSIILSMSVRMLLLYVLLVGFATAQANLTHTCRVGSRSLRVNEAAAITIMSEPTCGALTVVFDIGLYAQAFQEDQTRLVFTITNVVSQEGGTQQIRLLSSKGDHESVNFDNSEYEAVSSTPEGMTLNIIDSGAGSLCTDDLSTGACTHSVSIMPFHVKSFTLELELTGLHEPRIPSTDLEQFARFGSLVDTDLLVEDQAYCSADTALVSFLSQVDLYPTISKLTGLPQWTKSDGSEWDELSQFMTFEYKWANPSKQETRDTASWFVVLTKNPRRMFIARNYVKSVTMHTTDDSFDSESTTDEDEKEYKPIDGGPIEIDKDIAKLRAVKHLVELRGPDSTLPEPPIFKIIGTVEDKDFSSTLFDLVDENSVLAPLVSTCRSYTPSKEVFQKFQEDLCGQRDLFCSVKEILPKDVAIVDEETLVLLYLNGVELVRTPNPTEYHPCYQFKDIQDITRESTPTHIGFSNPNTSACPGMTRECIRAVANLKRACADLKGTKAPIQKNKKNKKNSEDK